MSVLPNQTALTGVTDWFVPNNQDIQFVSTISIYNGTINTSQINLDAVQMDCAIINSTPTLLLNGIPVASTSNFTSSISQWASFPALAPITYQQGAGTGGAINMANVNALSNVSSVSANFSVLSTTTASIAGLPYPMSMGAFNKIALPNPPSTVLNIQNGQIVPVDFGSQPAGVYVIIVDIQSGGVDPWTCQFFVTKGSTSGLVTSGTHFPSFNPYGSPISLANCVTAQCTSVGNATADVMFFSTGVAPNGIIGSTAQFSVYRLY